MQARTTFLRNLAHDSTANTLAIAAASLIPMMAMVGGGIDASRYYMATARMQAACDAGALAARRAMPTTVMTAEARSQGLNFFDQNFSDGMFGVTNRTRNYTANSAGKVTGTASGTLPSTIMAAFGYTQFPISVTCSAEVNISNTDIMFVLDVTGSMNCRPENLTGGNCNNTPEVGSKIQGLRDAAIAFYDVVASSTSPGAQVRYGVVPYSHNVNVGRLIPRQFMAGSHTYQSRVARYNPAAYPNNNEGDRIQYSDQIEWLPRNSAILGNTNIDNYRYRTDGANGTAAQNYCANYPGTYTPAVGGSDQRWEVVGPTEFVLNQWSGGASNNRAGCRARVKKTRLLTNADVTPQFREWIYCPVTTGTTNPCNVNNPARSPAGWEAVNLASVYTSANNQISLPIASQGAQQIVTWNGCIEEAATVNTGTWDPRPANAFDTDINLVPATEAQRWKPQLVDAIWRRTLNGADSVANVTTTSDNMARPVGNTCPPAARNLDQITRNDFQIYVNGLTAFGATYHSAGLVWGGRLISPRGIFQARNASAPNGEPIARHVIFMTDGLDNETHPQTYTPWGVETIDLRVTTDGSFNQSHVRHAARLAAVCRQLQQENITVWVVAFRQTLPNNLIECASPGRAYLARSNAELTQQFREIAQKIAALRLTQ